MKTIEIEVFKFSELSEEAKKKAVDWYCDNVELHWTDENMESLQEFEKIFPIKVKNWNVDACGHSVDWSFTGDDNITELSGVRLAIYIWNNYKRELFNGRYYSVKANYPMRHKRIVSKKLSNGNVFNAYYSAIQLDNSCVLTGYCMDDEILQPVYDFLNKPDKNVNFEDLMNNCFHSWGRACMNDYAYQQSEEYISDWFESNDYEFTEDGKIF